MARVSLFTIAFRSTAVALLGGFAAQAGAHHAFSTEIDADPTGEVRGEVTRVWWANPHIRYDVRVTLDDGTVEEWTLAPPGNLPSYRRENWFQDTVQAGLHRQCERQSRPRRREAPVCHMHRARERARAGAPSRPVRERREPYPERGDREPRRRLHPPGG